VGYESHYSPSQKACFVLIQYSDPSRERLGLQLFDAVEQRQYADFSSEKALILSCRLFPSDGEQKPCNSTAAFSAFVAGYMEAAPDLPEASKTEGSIASKEVNRGTTTRVNST
jgi:hypothetical protein